MTTIALGIPHAAWREDRAASMERLRTALLHRQADGTRGLFAPDRYREFTDRAPNHVWAEQMWAWALETGAEFFLTLQDDAIVAPFFWEALRAMLPHLPRGAVLGLAALHPAAPKLAEAGERWYRTRSWAVGWGYGLWREDLVEFLAWRSSLRHARIVATNEDSLLNEWIGETGRSTWHPLPTIVQHDTSLETNYAGNDAEDEYRTSAYTWKDTIAGIGGWSLSDEKFWRAEREPPLLMLPGKKPRARAPMASLREVETATGTVALAISHTPWMPERVESMARLRAGLRLPEALRGGESFGDPDLLLSDEAPQLGAYLEMTDRAPNAVWSERMWRWAAETAAEWCLFLQDDVRVAPNFWPALHAMLDALPEDAEVVCLENAHPAAKPLADEGARWLTTPDMLIGVGYVVRRSVLREFLVWRDSELQPGALDKGGLTEDTMLAVWCTVTGRRIWSPMPTIIDHDVALASTYGNDEHTNRRPVVRWDTPGVWEAASLEERGFWKDVVHHVGRFYPHSPEIAARWVNGVTREDVARWRADDGAPILTGLKYRMLARAYREPKYKILVCTPHGSGGVQPAHAASVFQLQRLLGIDLHHTMEIDLRQESQDLVRVRSRMLRLAYEGGHTHMLLADGDNAWSPEVVAAMLRTGKDFVQCPYLRRDGRGYSIRATEKDRRAGVTAPEDIQPDNTIEIEHTGFGLTLISRECMRRMIEHYGALDRERVDIEAARDRARQIHASAHLHETTDRLCDELERWRAGHMGMNVVDLVDGIPKPQVNLFQLMVRDGVQMSEDASFATRWRDIGGKVWLYIGNGSPIAHYGTWCFQGQIEDLGFTRGKGMAR